MFLKLLLTLKVWHRMFPLNDYDVFIYGNSVCLLETLPSVVGMFSLSGMSAVRNQNILNCTCKYDVFLRSCRERRLPPPTFACAPNLPQAVVRHQAMHNRLYHISDTHTHTHTHKHPHTLARRMEDGGEDIEASKFFDTLFIYR